MLRPLSTLLNHLPFLPYGYRGTAVTCNLCGTGETLPVSRYDRRLKRLATVCCEGCGLLRTAPMPTDAELGDYYARDYRFDYQWAGARTPPRSHLNRSRREAAERLALLAPHLPAAARILDFGSGSGEFLALAAAGGNRALGIEPGRDFAAHARRVYGVEVLTDGWQDVDLPRASFDLITAHHVLEHLREPVSALRRMADWLAPDGIMYLSVPNAYARRERAFQQFHFAHIHNFVPETLVAAAESAGLELDHRFPVASTTMVFRKRQGDAIPADPCRRRGIEIAGRFSAPSPFVYLLSLRWLVQAGRRHAKSIRDSRSERPARGRRPRRGGAGAPHWDDRYPGSAGSSA